MGLINRQHIPGALQISSAATLGSRNFSELSGAWFIEVCDDESALNDSVGAGEVCEGERVWAASFGFHAKPVAPTCAESSERGLDGGRAAPSSPVSERRCEGERGLDGAAPSSAAQPSSPVSERLTAHSGLCVGLLCSPCRSCVGVCGGGVSHTPDSVRDSSVLLGAPVIGR